LKGLANTIRQVWLHISRSEGQKFIKKRWTCVSKFCVSHYASLYWMSIMWYWRRNSCTSVSSLLLCSAYFAVFKAYLEDWQGTKWHFLSLDWMD